MTGTDSKQAILILSNGISKNVIKKYYKITKATVDTADVFLLNHTANNKIPVGYEGIKIETFTDEILSNMGYTPIGKTLVPGSNHFPVLQFFLKYPGYTYYWCIEDDVSFSGNWNDFFKNISANLDYDFITSHIRKSSDVKGWPWWKSLSSPEEKVERREMWSSFNPIYRISNKALQYIDTCLKRGYSGHHEVLMPTLLKKAGFKLADLGTKDNGVTSTLSYCTLTTMRWKPVYFVPGLKKNKLYHPVKAKVTFKQVLVYVKRTIYNQTEYFT